MVYRCQETMTKTIPLHQVPLGTLPVLRLTGIMDGEIVLASGETNPVLASKRVSGDRKRNIAWRMISVIESAYEVLKA